MSYVKQNFSGGQVLTATNLNHMEEGIASAGTVKSVNGVMPDENGNVLFDKPFTFHIEHSMSVNYPQLNSLKCTNKTLAQIREAFAYHKKHAIIGRLNRYDADLDKDDFRELIKYTVDYNGKDGGFRYILYFGDDIPPYILDINANTITLDPDWVAPAVTVKTINNVTPDENGDITIIEPYKYVFINSPLGFMAPYSVEELYAYCTDASAFNKNSFIHRVYNPLNPTQPTYEYMCTEVQSTSTQIKLLFDDKVAPIIIDKTANTITLDPDWVAPAPCATEEQVTEKVSLPKLASGIDHGQAGQFAVSDGMGGIMWKTLFEVEEVAY